MTHTRNESNARDFSGALLWVAVGLVAVAALARLVDHPWNFAPVGAMALFGGAALRRPLFAFGVPLTAMILSDLALGLMGRPQVMAPWIYGSFIAIGVIGLLLRRRRTTGRVVVASLGGSVLFFVVTNFGVWASGFGYPMTFEGLLTCYAAGIPFFWSTVAGDLFWNAALFGSFALMGRRAHAQTAVTPGA